MRAIVCVCVANWHLRKHERTPSDTDNHCSKARHRAAIFVLMTSLPSLLVPVFMCWLGYSIEPASDLQGCVYVCVCVGGGGSWTKTLFCFVAANVLASVLTKPSANLCSRFQVWNLPVFSPSVFLSLSVCLYNHASFCIGLPAYRIHRHIALHSASLPLTQITS